MVLPCRVLRSLTSIPVTTLPLPCTDILSKVETLKCHNIISLNHIQGCLDGKEWPQVLLKPIDANSQEGFTTSNAAT